MKKIILLLLMSTQCMAVYVSQSGQGDVIVVPYYTVNNNKNTLVTVSNPNNAAKAIKITFREGLGGYSVFSYNVYLGPFDSWSFGLVSTVSTIQGHVGEESVALITNDASCSPGLSKSTLVEFNAGNFEDGDNDFRRAREGYIEIIEMGDVTGAILANLDQGNVGVPANCPAFEFAWDEDGLWHTASGGDSSAGLEPGSGGLVSEVLLFDVANGISYSYPTLTFNDFFVDNEIMHTAPGDASLSLDAAAPVAYVQDNNQSFSLSTTSGHDAISAVLMASELIGTYALDTFVDGRTEHVYSMPTRRFYAQSGNTYFPPFNNDADGSKCGAAVYGGETIEQYLYDREAQRDIIPVIDPPPPPAVSPEAICGSVFVHNFNLPYLNEVGPLITGSNNAKQVLTPSSAFTESGFSTIEFNPDSALTATSQLTDKTIKLYGLPVIGISLTRYTNAVAQPGLLAQYGAAQKMASLIRIEESE